MPCSLLREEGMHQQAVIVAMAQLFDGFMEVKLPEGADESRGEDSSREKDERSLRSWRVPKLCHGAWPQRAIGRRNGSVA
jgi:hypothetical protein